MKDRFPTKEEYVQARITIARVDAERDWASRTGTTPPPGEIQLRPVKEYTRKEVAKILGRSIAGVRKLEERGFIHRKRNTGRKVLYTEIEVEQCKKKLGM